MEKQQKLETVNKHIGKKVCVHLPQQSGGVQLTELTLKSAWIAGERILVDFSELSEYNYVVNADIIGTMKDGRLNPLY